ncbi:MAG: S8 family peptidase [Candidatus Hydrogenedentes bacterium]|nr:S8 family peptidase [Candidatus Hydrogenedentota bacterium]
MRNFSQRFRASNRSPSLRAIQYCSWVVLACGAHAQISIQAEVRDLPVLPTPEIFAPALKAALDADVLFRGLSEASGDAIYQVPEGRSAEAAIASFVGIDYVRAPKLAPTLDTITSKLLVMTSDFSKLPTGSIAGFPILHTNLEGGYVVLRTPDAISPANLAAIRSTPGVKHVQPDYRYQLHADLSPNDLYFAQADLWGLRTIGATKAWSKIHDAKGIIIAFLDTGVAYDHPDLRDNMWDGASKHGFDFGNNDSDPMDDRGHGTACAGIAAATGNNERGVTGVAWRTKIMALKVYKDGEDTASDDAIIRAIDYAIQHGAKILNCSFGCPNRSSALRAAMHRAELAGVLVVVAAGNEGLNLDNSPEYPAAFDAPNIIAVAALEDAHRLAPDSNYSIQSVHLAAPGTGILTTHFASRDYQQFSGTSMAAPFVTGAAALVWAAYPNNSVGETKGMLLEHALPVNGLAEKVLNSGSLHIGFLESAPAP